MLGAEARVAVSGASPAWMALVRSPAVGGNILCPAADCNFLSPPTDCNSFLFILRSIYQTAKVQLFFHLANTSFMV
jgi:hypothetical protein